MYQVKLQEFEGPLSLLLQLIENEKLDISRLSLAKITDQFIEYLNQNPNLNSEELADFLVIVAKLLLIKSALLFPELKIEDEAQELVSQLKIYKEFYEASLKINQKIKEKKFAFFKEKIAAEVAFRPPKEINQKILCLTFKEILSNLEKYVLPLMRVSLPKISLKEKIEFIKKLIQEKCLVSFKELTSQKNKIECLVSFLALLELLKDRVITLEQKELFGDILIKKI